MNTTIIITLVMLGIGLVGFITGIVFNSVRKITKKMIDLEQCQVDLLNLITRVVTETAKGLKTLRTIIKATRQDVDIISTYLDLGKEDKKDPTVH